VSFFSKFFQSNRGSTQVPPKEGRAAAPSLPSTVSKRRAAAAPVVGASSMPYRPELVDKLKADHQDLLDIYARLSAAAQMGHTAHIAEDLMAFRRGFQNHILVENLNFYVYLERILANRPEELGYVRSLRQDMNGIAKVVADFIHTWISQPPTAQTVGQFETELTVMGQALSARIELEESRLYVLYVAV